MSEYLNRQDVLNAINDVMNDSEILHKFRALRKRINQIAVADVAEVVQQVAGGRLRIFSML